MASTTDATPRRSRPRGLRTQLSLLVGLVTVLMTVISVLVAYGLVLSAARTAVRTSLTQLADVAVASASGGRAPVQREVVALRKAGVLTERLARDAPPTGGTTIDQLIRPRYTQITAQASYRFRGTANGRTYFVESRLLDDGHGVLVLARPQATAKGLLATMVVRMLLALVAGLLVAVAAGLLVSGRIARPLRRTAAAADEIAAGGRDVAVDRSGPAEVAAVASSLTTLQATLAASEGRERESLLSVSHEFRTPLTAIKGYAEALADGVASQSQAGDAGRTIGAEADRLTRLVGDLMDLARLGAVEVRIEHAPTDVSDLVRTAAGVWADRCAAVGVRFDARLPQHPVQIETDAGRLRQIIDNLAENALRVTPSGQLIRFELSVPSGGGAQIQVRDSGPGLTEADIRDAFGRSVLYERYRGVRRVGTGMGLALVHALTTRLGGTATAGNGPEGGACFTVTLPG